MHGRFVVLGAMSAALVTYWAVVTLGRQFDLAPPGFLYDVWYSAAPELIGWALGFAVAAYLGRWWVLLAAAVPVLVLGGLDLAGHIAPWHDVGPPLMGWFDAGLGQYFVTTYILVFVLPLVLGVLTRRGLGLRGSATAA